jgi:hypothetical protein
MSWKEEIKKESNELKIVNSLMKYYFNTRPADLVDMLFGEVYGNYGQQWEGYYRAGFQVFWGQLDNDNRQKLIDAALEKY